MGFDFFEKSLQGKHLIRKVCSMGSDGRLLQTCIYIADTFRTEWINLLLFVRRICVSSANDEIKASNRFL